jgi:DNA-binding transcriptional regulator YdaS (Cro superfamily)
MPKLAQQTLDTSDEAPTALDRAIEAAGGQTALAGKITTIDRPVSQQNVWWWVNRCGGWVPDYAVLPIERETGISRYELRPDVFGPSPDQAAA